MSQKRQKNQIVLGRSKTHFEKHCCKDIQIFELAHSYPGKLNKIDCMGRHFWSLLGAKNQKSSALLKHYCHRQHGQINLHSSVRVKFSEVSHWPFFVWESISTLIFQILKLKWANRIFYSSARLCICALMARFFKGITVCGVSAMKYYCEPHFCMNWINQNFLGTDFRYT